jgi:hypothetical protein
VRDDFSKRTIDTLAKRAGYFCSNPECGIPTVGAAQGDDGFVIIGIAAHITAASPRGPRYDPSLSKEQRRHQSNGIWLCEIHGKQVDSDDQHFTVEALRKWKQTAEDQSFRGLVAPYAARSQKLAPTAPDSADSKLIENLGLPAQDDLESVTARLIIAAQADLNAFKGTPRWPRHAIALNLRMTTGGSVRAFHASALAEAIQTFNEIIVIAPPGTGKSTTLLQVVESILSQGKSVAAFIPLGEWSSQSDSLLQSVVRRRAFAGEREEHLKLLALSGRLVLVLDGWNELDGASRKRAANEIRSLQREFPGLGIVISTRRQALDVPISGPLVEIDTLAEGQQLEIARALRGSEGEAILDHAWRTPGIRELVAIPLYLTALLARVRGEAFPTTKDEVLRLFVTEHEQSAAKAEALREAIFGFHPEMLTALAVEATHTANTTILNRQACAVVKRVEDHLSDDGQITSAPQPTAVLDALVSHHLLVRSGAETGGGISFQHQQFQEWYASFEVERLMRAAASDPAVKQKLKKDVLNLRAWEEPILFACERVSRADQNGLKAVTMAILETIAIDPMLAAEMIYRASSGVWGELKEKVLAFVGRWHVSGRVDRAVHFMVSTGRSEFAPRLWPLISNADTQVYLLALRAGRRFRPSVLGDDVEVRIAELPEKLRENVVSEIARSSGMDGIELATRLAKVDASPNVKFAVIESLLFRRADRFAVEILSTAPDEVWSLLAIKGYTKEVADAKAAERLVREEEQYIATQTEPLRKLSVLLDPGRNQTSVGPQVGALIEATGFPVNDQHATWNVDAAYKLFPDEVTSALVHRLEGGLEIPFRTEDLLQAAAIAIDAGPLVDLVLQPTSPAKVAGAAACIVGSKTVGKLIDMLIAVDAELIKSESANPVKQKERERLSNWICRTGVTSFAKAVLSRSSSVVASEVCLLADLLARHGKEPERSLLQVKGELHESLIRAVEHWANVLMASPNATRSQFAKIATAVERLPAPQLASVLLRLLSADLSNWRIAHEEFTAALNKGKRIRSDAQTSWTLQYRRAFSAIGTAEVVEAMKSYLPDAGYCSFGVDAACVLKDIWDREQNSSKDRFLKPVPDFSEVKARRVERQGQGGGNSSPFADAIIAVIEDLIKPDSSDDSHRHALQLAKVAFSMPYGDKKDTIDTLLHLSQPLRVKQALMAVLVVAGEIIQADMVLDGLKGLREESKAKQWLLGEQNWWEWEGWLELIPFSDRSRATLDALELIEPNRRAPWQLRRLLSALGYAPGAEADAILALLPKNDPRFFSEHDWLAAVEKRGSASSARLLLDLICEGSVAKPGGRDTWSLSRRLAGTMFVHADFRAEVYDRYERMATCVGKGILEYAISEVADANGVLALVSSYAQQGKPFDGTLLSAIRHVAVSERPSMNWAGASESFSVPLPELRKTLFAMLKDDGAVTGLATACLTAIDELRDEYGPAESEPRHPDIDSGRPWPLAVGYHPLTGEGLTPVAPQKTS